MDIDPEDLPAGCVPEEPAEPDENAVDIPSAEQAAAEVPEDLPAERVPEEPAEPDENAVDIPSAEQAAAEVPEDLPADRVPEEPAEPDENAVDIPPADLAEQAAAEVAAVKLALTRGGSCGQTMPLKFW